MKFRLILAPTQRIIQDRQVELTLIGSPVEVPGDPVPLQQKTYFEWIRDVLVDGQIVDYEKKEGNLNLPYLPAEMLMSPNDFLAQINAIISQDPNMSGMVVTSVEKIGVEPPAEQPIPETPVV